MSSTKSSSRARPAVSAPPNSPRTEENQGYRRGRAIRSCLECRRRKMRCNRSRPCQNCNRFCRDCVYLPFPDWPSGASINVKAENSSQSPEQGVGRAIPSYASAQRTGLIQTSPFTHNHDHSFDPDTLAHHDGFYDSDADDQPLEVGLQIGRLCITERMNGFFRPQVANQITALLSQPARSVPPYDPQTSYGEPSNRHPAQPTQTAASPHYVVVERVSPLEPSPSLLATAAQSFLPQSRLELPTREELQLLCYQYWSAVDPLAHIVHKPSFEEERRKYLPHGQLIDTTPASFRALLLAMCLAAAVSLPLTQAERVLGVTQQTLVGRLKNATEKALADASFMNSVKIQTLQAFTVYMIPQCRAEISRSHTVYVGALIRLARGAGLNRDASVPEMDPVDCQVRRLLWHQIGFLELSTAEAQGTQPAVYDNDFNTPLPLNIQDDALGRPNNDSVSASFWTDATLSIIRSECCMLHRLVIGQRLRFENGQTDLKTVQHLVNVHKTRIERQYLQNLDEAIPIQRCAMLIGQIFNARCDAILLHRHSRFDVNTGLQTDVREALIQSCLTICESTAALETDPELAPWAWYARAHNGYERSIFLLVEVHRDPYSPHVDRINSVLDHVFGVTPKYMTRRDRVKDLLELLAEEFNKMTERRKYRNAQLTASDTSSSSPSGSGMAKTPEDGGQWHHWQPATYRHGYTQDLPPVSDDVWWPIAIQHGTHCDSTGPQHDGYTGPQQDYYSYGMG